MKIKKLNPIKACQRLKDILISGNGDSGMSIIQDDGISSPMHVYIGSFPTSGLPDDFMFITPNGSTRNEFAIADVTIALGILTKLTDFLPNQNRIDFLLERVSDILDQKLLDKDYEFRVLPREAIANGTSIINGYNLTLINIFCQIKK